MICVGPYLCLMRESRHEVSRIIDLGEIAPLPIYATTSASASTLPGSRFCHLEVQSTRSILLNALLVCICSLTQAPSLQ